MALSYRFHDVRDLLAKLERERGRVWDAVKAECEIDMCDSFFNFCVTAHSLREWIAKDARFAIQSEIHGICNLYPVLKACRDIANAHKHFNLATRKDTWAVIQGTSPMIDILQDQITGELSVAPARDNIDIGVLLGDGSFMGLWEFMEETVKAWQEIVEQNATSNV